MAAPSNFVPPGFWRLFVGRRYAGGGAVTASIESVALKAGMMQTKTALRREMKTRRRQLTAAERHTAAEVVAARALSLLLPMREIRADIVVATYWPLNNELDPRPLVTSLAQAGFALALPGPARPGEQLTFHPYRSGDRLVPGPFGVQVPEISADAVRPNILLVPLLAVDGEGYRLGYGGGFYDRTLAALRRNDKGNGEKKGNRRERLWAVGLAYDFQIIGFVPRESLDEPLDCIVTPSRVINRPG